MAKKVLKRLSWRCALSAAAAFYLMAPAALTADETAIRQTIWLQTPSVIYRGARAIHDGEVGKGIRLIKEGLELENLRPRDRINGLNSLCVGYTAIELYEVAIEHCDRALRFGEDWRVLNNRANARLELGQFEQAIADYERSLELYPGHRQVMRNLEIAQTRRELRAIEPLDRDES